MVNEPTLWDDSSLPVSDAVTLGRNFKSLRFPLWTENKARLIENYLRLFLYITKHGTYIDGFAAPQNDQFKDMWAAKKAVELEPTWLRHFWLCDQNATGVRYLEQLRDQHPTRRITVMSGDFNERVGEILGSGVITESMATFALLDQRTFECHWRTVERLATHKSINKIELFYFFPSGWIDRSLAAVARSETAARVERWWGRSDWLNLKGMDGTERARSVARRFREELGYRWAEIFPIHNSARRGRVMYHMIHASDHPEAIPLMVRAYRQVSGRPELPEAEQLDMIKLLEEIQQSDPKNPS